MKLVFVAFFSLVFLASCTSEEKKASPSANTTVEKPSATSISLTDQELNKARLTYGKAEIRHLPQLLRVAATVQPDETMTMPVSSLVPGRAEEIRVKLGDAV
ncbi:MAG: hypothetical protein K2Z81_14595, partial [Cyanobacteria bacterium]|nr:hypothetical protein [Cyanobacteriota bacterium]